MGGKCCGLNTKSRCKSLPHLKTRDIPIDTKVLYSDSRYFTDKQRQHYNQLLLEEAVNETQSILNNWESTKIIGVGSYGRVLLGKNKDTGEVLAIKEIPLLGAVEIESVCEEFKILSQLHHPNIVQCKGFRIQSQFLMIFMEFVAGGTIEDLLNKYGPFPENLIKKCTKEILKGLEYLHYHNIVHRDLKGNNILVNEECKLADFGSAKNVVGLEVTASVTGTLNWMAPEVISETGHGRFADIWSVGCLVVEMATGKPPWSQLANQLEMARIVCETDIIPEVPLHYSDELRSFVKSCFARNPYKRHNVCELLLHPFLT